MALIDLFDYSLRGRPDAPALEVESPGPDRPLFTARHFERFLGLKVKVRSEAGNFTGRIRWASPEGVAFEVDGEEKTLPLGSFKANLAEWPDRPR